MTDILLIILGSLLGIGVVMAIFHLLLALKEYEKD